jgi:peptidyl-Asp metalloendopeptidase
MLMIRLAAASFRRRVGLFLLGFALVCAALDESSAQSNALFQPVPSAAATAARADQSRQVDALRQTPTTASIELVSINLDALRGDTTTLALDAGPVQASRRGVAVRNDQDFSWFGELPGTAGQATLVVRNGNVTGSIKNGADLYRVAPVGDGVHALIKVDQSRFPPDHPPDFREVERQADVPIPAPALRAMEDAGDARVQIDVLVPYTAAAKAARADIEALIQLAVDETNQSYRNSRINIDLRLVGTFQIAYSESGKSFATINADQVSGTDPGLAQVGPRRDATGADLVALIVNLPGACGRAAEIRATAPTAHAVVHYDCATGNYSFGHELGHLMGARHDPFVDSSINPFAFGHGFVNGTSWRTVMAYADACGSCPRLQYWSNPDVLFAGVAMGSAATNNNARVLNLTRSTVAAFRPTAP